LSKKDAEGKDYKLCSHYFIIIDYENDILVKHNYLYCHAINRHLNSLFILLMHLFSSDILCHSNSSSGLIVDLLFPSVGAPGQQRVKVAELSKFGRPVSGQCYSLFGFSRHSDLTVFANTILLLEC